MCCCEQIVLKIELMYKDTIYTKRLSYIDKTVPTRLESNGRKEGEVGMDKVRSAFGAPILLSSGCHVARETLLRGCDDWCEGTMVRSVDEDEPDGKMRDDASESIKEEKMAPAEKGSIAFALRHADAIRCDGESW